ncbi:MAG: hypothetical protein ACI89T_000072 [Cognaticolwellia sp.]
MDIKDRINKDLNVANSHYEECISRFIDLLMVTVKNDIISIEKASRLERLVLSGQLPIETANMRLNDLIA